MNILNNIRFGVSLTLLVVAYVFVGLSGVLLYVADKTSGSELSSCDYKTLWKMFNDELTLIKQGLL